MSVSNVLPVLLQYQLLLKMYHWQTHSYARHKASDELYDQLSAFIDQLVEYGTSTTRLTINPQTIELYNMKDEVAFPFLEKLADMLDELVIKDKGLKARRDDLIGYIHQAMYLFNLM